MSRKRKVCFICGKPGADSKEHVVSRCLLPPGKPGDQRLTLPAHKKCNGDFSFDEEYVRDLIGPTTEGYPDAKRIFENTQRSWRSSYGQRRLKRILSKSWLTDLRSPAGLVVGSSIVIKYEKERLQRVGSKIAQGIIMHDTGNFCKPTDLVVAPIPANVVPQERDRELEKGNPYWLLLMSEFCLHTNYSDSVAGRRAYTPSRREPVLACDVAMLIALYSQALIVVGEVELPTEPPKDFRFLVEKDSMHDVPGDVLESGA